MKLTSHRARETASARGWKRLRSRPSARAFGTVLVLLLVAIPLAAAAQAPGEIVWQRALPGEAAAAGAIVDAPAGEDLEKLFVIGDRAGTATAFYTEDGATAWGPVDLRRSNGAGAYDGPGTVAAPAVLPAEGIVVFALLDGRVVALDAARGGRVLWTRELSRSGAPRPQVVTAPAVAADGSIVVATLTGLVHFLDPRTGAPIGERPFEADGPIEHAPLATLDARIFLTVQNPGRSLSALNADGDRDTGTPSIAYDVLPTAPPALDGTGRLVVANAGGSLDVRMPDGRMVSAAMDGTPVAQSVEEDGGAIWTLANLRDGGHHLRRMSVSGDALEEIAAFEGAGEAVGDVALDDGGLAVYATRGGVLRAVTGQGQEAWAFSPKDGAAFLSTPVLAGGQAFLASADGRVFAVATGSGSDRSAWPGFRGGADRRGHVLGPHFLPGERIFDAPPQGWTYEVTPEAGASDLAPVALKEIADRMMLSAETEGIRAIDGGRFRVALRPSRAGNGTIVAEPIDDNRGAFPPPAAGADMDDREAVVHVLAVPTQRLEVGDQVPIPINTDIAKILDSGPEVRAAVDGAATLDPQTRPFVWRRATRTLHAVVPGVWRIEWPLDGGAGTFPVLFSVAWPGDDATVQKVVQHAQAFDVTIDETFSNATVFLADGTSAPLGDGMFDPESIGRSVVVLSDMPRPGDSEKLGFLAIETVEWRDPSVFIGTRPAPIGSPLAIPADHEDPAGTPYIMNDLSRVIMGPDDGFHNREARLGPIVPVNVEDPDEHRDDLVLALYRSSAPLLDADGTAGETASPFPGWRAQERFYGTEADRQLPAQRPRSSYVPARSVLYDAYWPEVGEDDTIVIAAQNSREYWLDPTVFGENPRIYRQPDRTMPGYNPNEEHARIAGRQLYVFRSDLNTPESSRPFVLVAYNDPLADDAPKAKLFAVETENREHRFVFSVQAGQRIVPPKPIGVGVFRTKQITLDGSIAFKDRQGILWARRAGHDNGSVSVVNRYCYEVDDTFDDPADLVDDCPGDNDGMAAWLSVYAAEKRRQRGVATEDINAPLDVRFDISWPESAPVLRRGRTLLTAREGLPQILDQRGVEIAYQQSEALGNGPSVSLFDALAARTAKLRDLPPQLMGAKSETLEGVTLFPGLPPHLRHQFYFQKDYGLRFRGRFIDGDANVGERPIAPGDAFVLMNVLDPGAPDAIRNALDAQGADFADFNAALDALARKAAAPLDLAPAVVGEEPAAAEALALSATADGPGGYVTIVTGNDKISEGAGDPVEVHVIRVSPELETGRVIVIYHTNPFAEEVYVRHSGDFAGSVGRYEFDWRIVPAIGDTRAAGEPSTWPKLLPQDDGDPDANARLIKGRQQFSALDVTVRYRLRSDPQRGGAPGEWSSFTEDKRVRGWLERVVAGVNVFDDYLDNFRKARPDAVVSAVARAGTRYRGATPLNVDALQNLGLIEVYETVYRRGKSLGLDVGITDRGLSEQLQTFAGRLSDLYLVLGDEAYADAIDPTIVVPTTDGSTVPVNSELRAFFNTTGSLLEEELALLRGVVRRNTRQAPHYNRLTWGLTETQESALYVANYGPFESLEDLNSGERQDPLLPAKQAYPQGHGDAYGHYLMALKVYYQLLSHPNFIWATGRNRDSLGGTDIVLDYYDEQKLAQVAVARARTGLATIDLTHRRDYRPGPEGWLSLEQVLPAPTERDSKRLPQLDAAWGVADWASRSGQGAYLDWVAANALLPMQSADDDPQLGRLDRVSTPELRELSEFGEAIQERLDAATSGVNPVGAPEEYVPIFVGRDRALADNTTPFEILRARVLALHKEALDTLANVAEARQQARGNRDAARLEERNFDAEMRRLETRLIEVFGTPYPSDIGPGKFYAAGYNSYDNKRYFCMSRTELLRPDAPIFEFAPDSSNGPRTISITEDAWGQCIIEDPNARRRSPGLVQQRMRDVLLGASALERAVEEYRSLMDGIDDQRQLLLLTDKIEEERISIQLDRNSEAIQLSQFRRDAVTRQIRFERMARSARFIGNASAEALPRVFGFVGGMAAGATTDPTAPARAGILLAANATAEVLQNTADDARIAALDADRQSRVLELNASSRQVVLSGELADRSRLVEFDALLRREPLLVNELYARAEALRGAVDNYRTAVALGERLIAERNRLSALKSIDTTQRRYRELAYRLLTRESVDAYRDIFDRAVLDTFMLVRLLDFETNFPSGDPRAFAPDLYAELARVRSPGRLSRSGQPMHEGGGLSAVLARLTEIYGNYIDGPTASVPRTQIMQLRQGLFRIPRSGTDPRLADAELDDLWRDKLRLHVVDSPAELPDLANCCESLPQGPAIVIPFSTPVQSSQQDSGLNHFGFVMGAGETGFDADFISAKLKHVRVVLPGYRSGLLRREPQVYFFPAGLDLFLTPKTAGGEVEIRSWNIKPFDQLPNGPASVDATSLWFAPRARHTSFAALLDDRGADPLSAQAYTTQLFGRSVFNTRWYLLIPLRPLNPSLVENLGSAADDQILEHLVGSASEAGIVDIEIKFEFTARETGG